MTMEETGDFVTTQIATIITLVALTFSVLLTLITLMASYKKALRETASKIEDIEEHLNEKLVIVDECQNSIIKKLSFAEVQIKFINHTSLSTQSWNENKIATHLKYEFEIVDLVVRNFDEFDDPSGILKFKRFNLSRMILDLWQNKYSISEEKTVIIDSRRTISRIMENIKSDKVLTERLNVSGCLQDYDYLENAVDSLLINAETPKTNFVVPNLDAVKEMAK